jgi:hypothetical protein
MKRLVLILLACLAYSLPGPVLAQLDTTENDYLVLMREEEKLARDTYLTLYDLWSHNVFANIAQSEQRHMDAVLTALDYYGIADPMTDDTVGVFSNPILSGYYDELVAKGNLSLLDALQVGAYIEELDIADLWDAIEATDEGFLTVTYGNLLAGSCNHLRAFVGQITLRGVSYEAQVLSQAEVDDILLNYADCGGVSTVSRFPGFGPAGPGARPKNPQGK